MKEQCRSNVIDGGSMDINVINGGSMIGKSIVRFT